MVKRKSTLIPEVQIIVNSHSTTFSDSVESASYNYLNISYPAGQGATLEFLQRCLFKINPKGSKAEKSTSRKPMTVSPQHVSNSAPGGPLSCKVLQPAPEHLPGNF